MSVAEPNVGADQTVAYDIRSWAIQGARRFAGIWDGGGEWTDFWKRSNTFHAYLRFVDAAEHRWGANDPGLAGMKALRETMITANFAFFDEKTRNPDGIWADDYSWCGLSCLAARDYLLSVDDQPRATRFLGLAARCFDLMVQIGYDTSGQATPFPGGCGNGYPGLNDPGSPYGTKNTVTNANLLLLSLRLGAIQGGDAAKMAVQQASWFARWFYDSYVSQDDGPYLRYPEIGRQSALVHERPRAEKSYMATDRPGWNRGAVWSGDQGIVLMALAELLLDRVQVPGYSPSRFAETFAALRTGVHAFLFGPDGVLREAPFQMFFGYEFANDYVGGRGVLLRYLAEPKMQRMMDPPFDPAVIRATAQAVWESRDPATGQFGSLWNAAGDRVADRFFVERWGTGGGVGSGWQLSGTYDPILQANGLDAFTAAIRLVND